MLRNTQFISREREELLRAEEYTLHVEFFRHVCRTSIKSGESPPHVARDQNEVRIGDVGAAHVEPLHDFMIPCQRNVLRDEVMSATLTYLMQ
jgi:hypothetical protein